MPTAIAFACALVAPVPDRPDARAGGPPVIPIPSAWIGVIEVGRQRLPYLLRLVEPEAGAALGATLDRIDQVGEAQPALDAQIDGARLVLEFGAGGSQRGVLTLEGGDAELVGSVRMGVPATISAANFIPMAQLGADALGALAGEYASDDGERVRLAADEDGFLVAHFPREQRFQMLFPAGGSEGDSEFVAGPGCTLALPVEIEAEVADGTLVWREGGELREYDRVDAPLPGLALAGAAIERGELRLPLVEVAAGTFRMGQHAPSDAVRAALGVKLPSGAEAPRVDPVRTTTLSRPFLMARTEVTNAWFAAFVEETGHLSLAERAGWAFDWDAVRKRLERVSGLSWRRPGFEVRPDAPVVFVSWHDAVAFCRWLTRRIGRTVRLPSEAEWEYACAAGSESLFTCGDDPRRLDELAWSARNAKEPQPVATRAPNAWGLFDLHGNVWEWCADAFAPIAPAPATDPTGPPRGATRLLRGGSWLNEPISLRSAFRGHDPPNLAEPHIGFRVVVDAQG